MSMQTIQLDISNDIFDKVIAFLEILPKSKIKFKIVDNIFTATAPKKNENKEISLQTLQSKSMGKTWDNKEDEAWNEL